MIGRTISVSRDSNAGFFRVKTFAAVARRIAVCGLNAEPPALPRRAELL